MTKKWTVYTVAAAALCVLQTPQSAQAYDQQAFLRQYKDTIAIVETNSAHRLPISEYEKEQLFKRDFLMRAAEFGPQALLDKVLSLATSPLQLIQEDRFGRTALFYAANAQAADSLLNRFLSLETVRKLKDGLKIGYAAMNEGPVPVRLKAQRFLNKKDREGATALMILLRDGKTGAALRLLQRGADPCVTDKDGVTPLHMAVLAAREDNPAGLHALRQILKACPQNISAKTKDGLLPADWARRGDFGQAYELLEKAQKTAKKQKTYHWEGKLNAL